SIEGFDPLEVEVEVVDRALPDRDVAKIESMNFGSLIALEKKDPSRFLEWMQLAHAHHVTVEIMRIQPNIARDGSIDWTGWADRIEPLVDGTAFTSTRGYDGPRAGLPVTR